MKRFIKLVFVFAVTSGIASTANSENKYKFFGTISNALTAKQTWVPALGAIFIAASGQDDEIAKWSSDNNYLFGSQKNAILASNQLNAVGTANLFLSSILLPTPANENHLNYRGKQLIFSSIALETTYLTTNTIKNQTKKMRPDGSDRLSFPSGHTSHASVLAGMSARNIQENQFLTDTQKTIWGSTTRITAGLTGWARMEGKKHYPVDVLLGYSLGNFVAEVVNQSFLHSNSVFALNLSSIQQPEILFSYQW